MARDSLLPSVVGIRPQEPWEALVEGHTDNGWLPFSHVTSLLRTKHKDGTMLSPHSCVSRSPEPIFPVRKMRCRKVTPKTSNALQGHRIIRPKKKQPAGWSRVIDTQCSSPVPGMCPMHGRGPRNVLEWNSKRKPRETNSWAGPRDSQGITHESVSSVKGDKACSSWSLWHSSSRHPALTSTCSYQLSGAWRH